MRLCDSHSKLLHEALEDRGLAHFVPKLPEQAEERLRSRIASGPSRANYDPLTDVTLMIGENALRTSLAITTEDEEHDHMLCPLCYLNLCHKEGCDDPRCDWNYDRWITIGANQAFERALSLGLIGQA